MFNNCINILYNFGISKNVIQSKQYHQQSVLGEQLQHEEQPEYGIQSADGRTAAVVHQLGQLQWLGRSHQPDADELLGSKSSTVSVFKGSEGGLLVKQ